MLTPAWNILLKAISLLNHLQLEFLKWASNTYMVASLLSFPIDNEENGM